tara:strand:- start:101 stop:268 length:168 start_codon:yes stop_codon:yes gene_type:complete
MNKYLICEKMEKYEYYYVYADTQDGAIEQHKEHRNDSQYYDAEYGDTLNVEVISE